MQTDPDAFTANMTALRDEWSEAERDPEVAARMEAAARAIAEILDEGTDDV